MSTHLRQAWAARIAVEEPQFTKATPRSMGGSLVHRLSLGDAFIEWRHDDGVVHKVEVPTSQRRQGIATDLWNKAHEVAAATRGVKPPRHSPDRTTSGDAWARSLGDGRQVPRKAYDP